MAEDIKNAIRHFESMKNGAVSVLDTGFGTHKGESSTVYLNRKKYAELAIQALTKQLEMIEYCDDHPCCDTCEYRNTEDVCMNDFIIEK